MTPNYDPMDHKFLSFKCQLQTYGAYTKQTKMVTKVDSEEWCVWPPCCPTLPVTLIWWTKVQILGVLLNGPFWMKHGWSTKMSALDFWSLRWPLSIVDQRWAWLGKEKRSSDERAVSPQPHHSSESTLVTIWEDKKKDMVITWTEIHPNKTTQFQTGKVPVATG